MDCFSAEKERLSPGDVFQRTFVELMNFLAESGVDLANQPTDFKPLQGDSFSLNYVIDRVQKAGLDGILYMTIEPGAGIIYHLTLKALDASGKLLWEEKTSSTWSWVATESGSARSVLEAMKKKLKPRIGKAGLPLRKDPAK